MVRPRRIRWKEKPNPLIGGGARLGVVDDFPAGGFCCGDVVELAQVHIAVHGGGVLGLDNVRRGAIHYGGANSWNMYAVQRAWVAGTVKVFHLFPFFLHCLADGAHHGGLSRAGTALEDQQIVVVFRRAESGRAYRALGAARQMDDSAAVLAAEGLDREKLLRRTDGIIGRELRGKGSGGRDAYRFLGSLTCRGPVWRFDSVQALCPKIYQLQDAYGLAAPMLQRLHAAASARGFSAIVCPDPEHAERIQHLLLPELGLGFVTSREGMAYTGPAYRRVRLDAMVSASHYKRFKARLRFSARVSSALREEGLEALREAKAAHDQLEAVYHPHVDFAGVQQLAEEELARIESYL